MVKMMFAWLKHPLHGNLGRGACASGGRIPEGGGGVSQGTGGLGHMPQETKRPGDPETRRPGDHTYNLPKTKLEEIIRN